MEVLRGYTLFAVTHKFVNTEFVRLKHTGIEASIFWRAGKRHCDFNQARVSIIPFQSIGMEYPWAVAVNGRVVKQQVK